MSFVIYLLFMMKFINTLSIRIINKNIAYNLNNQEKNTIYNFKNEEINNNKTNFTFVSQKYTGNPPSPRRDHSSLIFDNFMVIFGGKSDLEYFNDLYFLNLNTNEWFDILTFGNKPSPRKGHIALIYNSSLFVIGGKSSSNKILNSIYSLNLNTVNECSIL